MQIFALIMKKPLNLIRFVLAYILYLILIPIAFLVYGKKKAWVFCERGIDAKDNSMFMFKWVNKNHPEINSYYVISKKSPDYRKACLVGKTVKFHSLKHWLIYIASKVRLSTHLYSCAPNKFLGSYFLKYSKKSGVDVFLQHGITHNFQDCFFRKNNKADIVVCGAEPEYNYLLSEFDLGKEHLKLTGFPRYDSLINSVDDERFILIQPTWRSWLSNLSDDEFIKTNYFISWSSLLNNSKLSETLKAKNVVLKFNMHPSLIKYEHLFKTTLENVEIIKKCDDIQGLFNKASLLITDYSSILFDFAYLRKPTLYYQFDEEEFYSKQYKHGFFVIKEDGFGETTNNENDLVNLVMNYAHNNFVLKDIYLNRINKFFNFNDSNNCQRVYDEIVEKLCRN